MRPSHPHLHEAHNALALAETVVQAAPPQRAPLRIAPGALLKHDEIIRKLGEGGMGTVFLARDTRLGRLVAIKFLLEYSGPAADRFLAEARVTARCRHDNILGTRLYMAPEQWEGMAIDARTDIWAVGILLYELVTGIHPLAPFSMANLEMVSVLDQPMPSVRDRRPDAGPIAEVIDRCLAKQKSDRFGSASELFAALEPLTHEQDARLPASLSNMAGAS